MTASSNVNENDGNVATTTNSITATNAAAVITGSTTPSSSRDDSVRLWLAAEADLVKFLPKWSELTHHNVECGRYGCNCTDGSIRLWLAAEAGRVKSIPKWSGFTHHNVECGRGGCNCTDGECGGIPIKNDFRWEKKNQENLGWPHDQIDVPGDPGYEEARNTMLQIRRFCEPCFELLVERSVLQCDDYERVKGETLFDVVTKEMIEATTERLYEKHRGKNPRHNLDNG